MATRVRVGAETPAEHPARAEGAVVVLGDEVAVAWPEVGRPVAVSPLAATTLSLLDGTVSRNDLAQDLARAGICTDLESWTVTGDLELRLRGARLLEVEPAPVEEQAPVSHTGEGEGAPDLRDAERRVLELTLGTVEVHFVRTSPPAWFGEPEPRTLQAVDVRERPVGVIRVRGTGTGGAVWVRAAGSSWLADAADEVELAHALAQAMVATVSGEVAVSSELKVIEASVFCEVTREGDGEPSAVLAPLQELDVDAAAELAERGIRHLGSTSVLVEAGARRVHLPDGRRLMRAVQRGSRFDPAEVLVAHSVESIAVSGPLGSQVDKLIVPALVRRGTGWTSSRHPAMFASSPSSLHRWVSAYLPAAGSEVGGNAPAPRPKVRLRPGPARSEFLSVFSALLATGAPLASVKVRPGELLCEREIYSLDPARIGEGRVERALERALGGGQMGRGVARVVSESIDRGRDVTVGFEGEVEGYGLKIYVAAPGEEAEQDGWVQEWDSWRELFGADVASDPPRIVAPKWPAHDPEQVRLAEYRGLLAEEVEAELDACFGRENRAWADVVEALMTSTGGAPAPQPGSDPRGSTAHLLLTEGRGRRSVDLATAGAAQGSRLEAALGCLAELAGLGRMDRARLMSALDGRAVFRAIGGCDGRGRPLVTLYYL